MIIFHTECGAKTEIEIDRSKAPIIVGPGTLLQTLDKNTAILTSIKCSRCGQTLGFLRNVDQIPYPHY